MLCFFLDIFQISSKLFYLVVKRGLGKIFDNLIGNIFNISYFLIPHTYKLCYTNLVIP